MRTFSDLDVCRVVFAPPASSTPSSARARDRGAASQPRCSILSARAALHAWPRPQMAREGTRETRAIRIRAVDVADEEQTNDFHRMQSRMARALMATEMFMALANCGGSISARARAEKLLDDYFALVEQAIPWTQQTRLIGAPDPSTGAFNQEPDDEWR